jgi:hypothetical protein
MIWFLKNIFKAGLQSCDYTIIFQQETNSVPHLAYYLLLVERKEIKNGNYNYKHRLIFFNA